MISIIIPVFNREKYLRTMIDSIIDQTYKDWELILIDDGSSDQSFAICKEYEEKYDRIHAIQQAHEGPGIARNTGIALSKGEYIYFADSDDWIDKEMLQVLYDAMEKNDADMVVSNYQEEYEDGPKLGMCVEKGIHVYDNMECIKKFFANEIYSCLCTSLIRRAVIVEPFSKLYLYEDYITLFKWASHVRRLVTVDKAFYHYRQHTNSLVHKRDELASIKMYLDAFLERWNYIKDKPQFNSEPSFFIEQYVTTVVKSARDTARTPHSYKELKPLMDEYITMLKKQDIPGGSFPMKIRVRRYLILKVPHAFVSYAKLTAHFSKGYKRNQHRDKVLDD